MKRALFVLVLLPASVWAQKPTVIISGDGAATVISVGTQGPAGPNGAMTGVVVVDGLTYPADGFGIQAAVNALPTSGGQIYIPSGTYTIKGSITLKNNVRLTGAGISTVLKHANETLWTFAQTAASGQNQVVLTDTTGLQVGMSLVLYDNTGDEGENANSRKVTAINGTTVTLSANLTRAFLLADAPKAANVFDVILADGFHYGASPLSWIEVDHLKIDGNKANVGTRSSQTQHGISVYSVQNFWIHDLTVDSAEYSGLVNGGVNLDVWARITDNTFSNNGQNGIHPGATYRQAIVSNNIIKGNAIWGFFFCESTQHVTFSGNLVADNGEYGVTLGWNNFDNVIADNVIIRNGWAGIYGQHDAGGNGGAHHIAVTGNVLMDNGQALPNNYPAIGMYNSTYWTVEGNVIRDTQTPKTQRYGIAEFGTADYNSISNNTVVGSGYTADLSLVGPHDVVVNQGNTAGSLIPDPLSLRGTGTFASPDPQIFYIYSFCDGWNGTTCATGYERLAINGSATPGIIHEYAGTGASRGFKIGVGVKEYLFGGTAFYPTTSDDLELGASSLPWKNANVARSLQGSKCKNLTPSSATEFVRVAIPQGAGVNFAAGEIIWSVYDCDAIVDTQTLQGRTAFNCANGAGTEGCAALVTALNTLVYPSAGASKDDLACTFTTVTGLTDQVGFAVNCSTTEMTETTSKICYRLDMPQPNVVTPQ